MRGAIPTRERILLATAAVIVGLLAVLGFLPPFLSQAGRGPSWLWLLYGAVLLVPVALLIPGVIRPRSVTATVVAALGVGVLLIWGMSFQPVSWPRLVIHLAAILCLGALVSTVIRGVAGRRFRVLWIVPGLLLSLPIAYLAAGLIGLHIVMQVCNWPPLGQEVSAILCSG